MAAAPSPRDSVLSELPCFTELCRAPSPAFLLSPSRLHLQHLPAPFSSSWGPKPGPAHALRAGLQPRDTFMSPCHCTAPHRGPWALPPREGWDSWGDPGTLRCLGPLLATLVPPFRGVSLCPSPGSATAAAVAAPLSLSPRSPRQGMGTGSPASHRSSHLSRGWPGLWGKGVQRT